MRAPFTKLNSKPWWKANLILAWLVSFYLVCLLLYIAWQVLQSPLLYVPFWCCMLVPSHFPIHMQYYTYHHVYNHVMWSASFGAVSPYVGLFLSCVSHSPFDLPCTKYSYTLLCNIVLSLAYTIILCDHLLGWNNLLGRRLPYARLLHQLHRLCTS